MINQKYRVDLKRDLIKCCSIATALLKSFYLQSFNKIIINTNTNYTNCKNLINN